MQKVEGLSTNVKLYNYREEKTETLSEYKEDMEKTHGKYTKLRQEVIVIFKFNLNFALFEENPSIIYDAENHHFFFFIFKKNGKS